MSEGNLRPRTRSQRLNVRVEPGLHERVRVIAGERFEGIEAMAFRDALETYVELNERLGVDFERVVADMLKPELAVA